MGNINPDFKGKSDKSDIRINYYTFIPLWEKYIDTYAGGINIKQKKYLPRENIELQDDYYDRFKRAYYSNYTQKVINDYDKYIWKIPPLREGLSYYLDLIRFYSETGDILSINDYFRQLDRKVYIYGEMFGIISHDKIPDGIVLTDASRKQLDLKYKIQMVNPICVPVFNDNRCIIDTNINEYVEINHNGMAKFKDEKIVEIVNANYRVLPVFRAYIDDNNDGFGESLIRDISDINIEIYQLESSLSVDFREQTYSPFMMPVSAALNNDFYPNYYGKRKVSETNPDGIKREVDVIDFKIQKVMPVPETGFEGKFLNKDSSFVEQKENHISKLVETIRRLASQRFEEIRAQSGIAKYMDIEDSNTALYILSTFNKQIEYKFWDLWFRVALNQNLPNEINIQYNTDFNIKDYSESIKQKQEYLTKYFDASQTATKKMLYNYINDIELFTSKEKEQINRELDIYLKQKQLEKQISLNTVSDNNYTTNASQLDKEINNIDKEDDDKPNNLDNYGNVNIINRELTRSKGIVKGDREDEKFKINNPL